MNNWIPTNGLQFVEREVPQKPVWNERLGRTVKTKTVRILQQKWVESFDPDTPYEWRDVPRVEEE